MRARSAVILSAVAATTLGKEFLGQMEMYPVAPANQSVEELGNL